MTKTNVKRLTTTEVEQELWKMARKAARAAIQSMMDIPFQRMYLWFTPCNPGEWGDLFVATDSNFDGDGVSECLGQLPGNMGLDVLTAHIKGKTRRLAILGADEDGVLPRE